MFVGKRPMKTLKKMISRYMQIISWALIAFILCVYVLLQLLNEQRWACETAERTFYQMEQVLSDNQKELESVEENYKQTCLRNAEAIAVMIEAAPGQLDETEEYRKLAGLLEVDEIHIFDATGRIYMGTHPEYFGLTVDAGEQIGFFKPLLEDKSLKLVQDIMPNTAESKQMQYSALWSEHGNFIVQVGMEPVNVMKVTEKNELSYIFSMFRANVEANYYAVDAESGEIIGATDLRAVGRNMEEIGFSRRKVENDRDGFHVQINGQLYFCVFKQMGDKYICRAISGEDLYGRVPYNAMILAVCLIVIVMTLSRAVTGYMNKYVVGGIHAVNDKLRVIAKGELEEQVEVRSCVELAELSSHINEMVQSILDSNHKMSYVLSKTNMYMGIYEYNTQSKKVRFTEYMPRILLLRKEEIEQMSSDSGLLQDYLEQIRKNPVPGEEGVYKLKDDTEHYVRLEEITEKNQVFGVAIDVTEDIRKLLKTETERDVDALTGLYNRRGLEYKMEELFETPPQLGCNAIIMLDADGLKGINDQYGHDKGDVYLKKIAGVINNFGIKSSLAARLGGDEFVLFLYEYDDEKELLNTIKTLEYIQQNSSAKLGDNISVPLSFSMGYCMESEETDYQKRLKIADEKMYENKRKRKEQQ